MNKSKKTTLPEFKFYTETHFFAVGTLYENDLKADIKEITEQLGGRWATDAELNLPLDKLPALFEKLFAKYPNDAVNLSWCKRAAMLDERSGREHYE